MAKYLVKYYKNKPDDMTVLEMELETEETMTQLLGHAHVLEVTEIPADTRDKEEKVENKKVKSKKK